MLDLAAHLKMTAGRMMKEMTVREFLLWRVHYRNQPWGEFRADFRSAQSDALFINAHRDTKKHPDPIKATDLMPFYKEHDDSPKDIVAPETKAWFYAAARRSKGEPSVH